MAVTNTYYGFFTNTGEILHSGVISINDHDGTIPDAPVITNPNPGPSSGVGSSDLPPNPGY